MESFVILIAGPTGVGKTDFVEKLTRKLKEELLKEYAVINADVGQFYEPINIGTAKPENLKDDTDFLFGIIKEPKDINVNKYREMVLNNVEKSLLVKKNPIIVGGSGFYLRSLFYVIEQLPETDNLIGLKTTKTTEELWQELENIDPERAKKITKNDRYRLERALQIWYSTNIKPSQFKPKFDVPFEFKFIYLTRSRTELYKLIDDRVIKMMKAGWIDEVRTLSRSWIDFLKIKKIIGYPEIIEYLENLGKDPDIKLDAKNFENLVLLIQQKTRNYAKRQETFFRQLMRDLKNENRSVVECNLTLSSVDLYIDELMKELKRAHEQK